MRSLYHLGMLRHAQGALDVAERLLLEALAIRERVLGGQHPDTANVLVQLGRLRLDRGNVAGALPLLRQAASIHAAGLGALHPYTARSHLWLGLCERRLGAETAAHHLGAALQGYGAVCGPDHPWTRAAAQLVT